jgi:predicted secreted protein
MATKGHDIIIGTMSGSTFTTIAAVKSQSITTQCGLIETASATQQEWEEYVAGRKSWSLTVSYLVLSNSTCNIEDVLKIGTKVVLMMKGRTGGYSVKGEAIVVTCKQDFQDGTLSQGSYQFKGSGPLQGH